MKLRYSIITFLLMIVFSVSSVLLSEDKPLERLGNEAAASADSLYAENEFLGAAQKYEDAYNYFVRAEEEDEIPLADKQAQMLANMVTTYYQGEDYENAVRVIKKRLVLDPSNDTFARQIAQIYERILNDPQRAVEVLVDFEENNNNFTVRRTIARLYADMENYSEALNWYQKTFELRQDPEVLQNIALLHHRLGNTADAIAAYEGFIATEPRESVLINVYRNMGRFYDDIGDEQNSILYYERSNRLRFNRDVATLLMTKYYDRGDHLNAKDKANQLLRDNPNNAHAIYYTGLMLFEEERYTEAKGYFERITNDRSYGSAARQYVESIESMF